MYTYDIDALKQLLGLIMHDNISPDVLAWLMKQGNSNNTAAFHAAFVMMPRKTGRLTISVTPVQITQLNTIRPNFNIEGWTADRLGRVFLLTLADAIDRSHYLKVIESLFRAGEMNELVALYSALPLLAYPESWAMRCAEGIRSNIGNVLEAIMYRNPYPSEQLSADAWNQLVMKAIFTEKEIGLIIGLYERNNAELARILLDHARERGAAGRTVPTELWKLAQQFTEAGLIDKLKQDYQLN
ncbi:EboA domain-containing protein [Mucilaginibacter sp. ZT4R22]|uniref:EboA domain-containing protein n=1 Tax=Mucilaginibacter pankratovii TaxID=2772110 RepID=A0ABR7WNA9_9SPHI|nr:EboA domain-containing protein [Mucilaginibacter pankratovii]MBD1363790.1 EboA domain-containing protein [Mucilaginibacter pankratovii]